MSQRTRVLFGLWASMLVGATAAAQAPSPPHVGLVLAHLEQRSFPLPKGDFLLIASQPAGNVGEVVVYDLDRAILSVVPGTNSANPPRQQPLPPPKVQLVRELLQLPTVQNLPPTSGRRGLDGSATVVIYRVGARQRQLGHWSPDAAGMELLGALYDRELRTGASGLSGGPPDGRAGGPQPPGRP
ncbi:MAG: hypothetical protein U0935_17370 [Pirellulales bacterium]